MIAGSIGVAPGIARASGKTTSELRVLALKATERLAGTSSRSIRATNHPIRGAIIAKAM